MRMKLSLIEDASSVAHALVSMSVMRSDDVGRASFNRVGNAPRVERRTRLNHQPTRGALPTRLNELACSVMLRAMIVALVVVCTLPGCAGMRGFGNRSAVDPMAGAPKPRWAEDPQVEEVVDHLNRNVEKLHAWQANKVKIRAKVDNIHVPLSGMLAVERGRHLRLVVDSLVGNEVDIGSNDERFWVWAKRMPAPQYVSCRHEQLDDVRQSMGIPFEPEWLMQALGVSPLTVEGTKLEIEPTARQARLVQQITSAHGKPLRKVVLVDLQRGVIVEHSVYDYHGQRIAVARLEDHQLDKASGAVLPRRVKLDCPQSDLSLVMQLGPIEVNPRSIPSQIWDMPKMPGYQMVDLGAAVRPGARLAAGAGLNLGVERTAASLHGTTESPIQFLPPEFSDETDDEDTSGRVKLTNDEPMFDETSSSEKLLNESPFDRSPQTNDPPIRQMSNPGKRPIPRDWWSDN